MTQDQQPKTGAPWPIIIMLSMLGLVLGSGFILSPKTEEDKLWWIEFLGTTNHGILVNPPVELSPGDLLSSEAPLESSEAPWSAFDQPTFKLVVLNVGDCDSRCQDMLRSTRQLHVRLNRDYKDVERGFLALSLDTELASSYVEDLPDYTLLKMGNAELLDRLAGTNIPTPEKGPLLLMINPLNIIMMAYTSDHTGSEVLEDLEHVLDLAR